MHTVEFYAGMHIQNAAVALCAAARKHGKARGTFNEIELTASRDTDPAEVVASFGAQQDARTNAWRESPEGIAHAAKMAAEVKAAQQKHDEMVAALDGLDFTDGVAVLDWVCSIQSATDRVGVQVDREKILAAFAARGFAPNVNCGEAFNPDDRDNVLRYIVGQALDGVRSVAIHGVIHKFAADWKAKFDN